MQVESQMGKKTYLMVIAIGQIDQSLIPPNRGKKGGFFNTGVRGRTRPQAFANWFCRKGKETPLCHLNWVQRGAKRDWKLGSSGNRLHSLQKHGAGKPTSAFLKILQRSPKERICQEFTQLNDLGRKAWPGVGNEYTQRLMKLRTLRLAWPE